MLAFLFIITFLHSKKITSMIFKSIFCYLFTFASIAVLGIGVYAAPADTSVLAATKQSHNKVILRRDGSIMNFVKYSHVPVLSKRQTLVGDCGVCDEFKQLQAPCDDDPNDYTCLCTPESVGLFITCELCSPGLSVEYADEGGLAYLVYSLLQDCDGVGLPVGPVVCGSGAPVSK